MIVKDLKKAIKNLPDEHNILVINGLGYPMGDYECGAWDFDVNTQGLIETHTATEYEPSYEEDED